MLVAEIPEQTGPDVEQKLKTKSGGEFEVPGGVPRGARARGPQFTPPQRFATFALRLQPFASEFRDGAPVCSENDAFPERKGDLNFATEHRSAAKTMPGSGDAGTRAEISVSLQTGARSPVACSSACLFSGCLFTGCLLRRFSRLLMRVSFWIKIWKLDFCWHRLWHLGLHSLTSWSLVLLFVLFGRTVPMIRRPRLQDAYLMLFLHHLLRHLLHRRHHHRLGRHSLSLSKILLPSLKWSMLLQTVCRLFSLRIN